MRVTMSQSLRWLLFLVFLLAACSPVAVEPAADLAGGPTATSEAYPALIPATATLPPYPWPTATSAPTIPPEPTEEPTETIPPVPTSSPTPVVTPIPTAAPPIIPFPDGTTTQPFTLIWRDGDVIRTLHSEGEAEPTMLLDPAAEFALHLPPIEANIRSWGSISPNSQTLALVLIENPNEAVMSPYPAHIYLYDGSSRNLRQLAKYGADPIWSPDGKRLAYRSLETGGLWIADVVSGKTTEVYAVDLTNGHSLGGITWSHDSRHLALIDQVLAQSTDLVVVDVEQLEPPQAIVKLSTYLLGRPQWSPADDLIAFMWAAGEGAEGPHLWLINSDGSEEKQLTNNIIGRGGLPIWSVDGVWIAFSGQVQHEKIFADTDLWLVNSRDYEIKRLTSSDIDTMAQFGANALMPLWTPDGAQIVFARVPSQDGLAEVWVLSLTDGSVRKLLEIMNVFDVGLTVSP